MEYTLVQKNQALVAYMGGPSFLKNLLRSQKPEEEILLMGPEELQFHSSWDWIMPVWGKANKALMDGGSASTIYAMSKAIDNVDIEAFHKLLSAHCIIWCKNKQIAI